MKITIQTNKVKCDAGNCRNPALYSLIPDGVNADGYIHLCKDCARKIYLAVGSQLERDCGKKCKKRKRSVIYEQV